MVCKVYFGKNKKNAVNLPHSAQRKHAFLVKKKEKAKSKKLATRKKVDLELLHQILGHTSTISLMDEDTGDIWQDIGLRIYP